MNDNDFTSMSFDELWELYEKLTAKLAHEVAVEKAKLEGLLRKIESGKIIKIINCDLPERDRASDLGRPRTR